jgi:PAS domain S-box-containing protein
MVIKNENKLSSVEIKELQQRVLELEQTVNSIQGGEVDAFIINNKKGEASVFTLEGADQPYRILIESLSEGAITLAGNGNIIHCNKKFSEMINIPAKDTIGTSFFKYIPETQHNSLRILLDADITKNGKGEFLLHSINNSSKTVLLSCQHLKFGHVDGVSIVVTDISELHQMHQKIANSLKEKECMLKEIYHRVKNNLQIISSLFNWQGKTIQDPVSRQIFIENSTRVKAMALVHEMFYQSDNLAQIKMGKYVRKLSKNLNEIYHTNSNQIKLIIDIDNILLSIESAVPYGLVINELISNAFKHAFLPEQSGEVSVSIKKKSDNIILIVSDNGVGFSSDIDFYNTKTLGIQLIHTLTKQLRGNIVLDRNTGTTFTLTFPSKER